MMSFPIRTLHAPILTGTCVVSDGHVSIRFGSDERDWSGESLGGRSIDEVLAFHEVERV